MSLPQIMGYFENIQKAKIRELKLLAVIISNAAALGNGRVEQETFDNWIMNLGAKKDLTSEAIKDLKEDGILEDR